MESGSPPRLGWGLKRANNPQKGVNPSRLLQSARDGHPATTRHLTDQMARSQPTQSALVHRRTMPVSKRCASVYPRAYCRGPQRNPARRPRASNESEPQTRSSTRAVQVPHSCQARVGDGHARNEDKPNTGGSDSLGPSNGPPANAHQAAANPHRPSGPKRTLPVRPTPTSEYRVLPRAHPAQARRPRRTVR